jgi:TRAP-type uncharacterized transport system substrate-binding protein
MSTPSKQAEGHKRWTRPPVMRSRFAIEVAAELVAMEDQSLKRARVQLRHADYDTDWPINLLASSTMEGIDAVTKGEATLSLINPAAILTMAYRGTGPFREPLPLRLITTFPSPDACALAASKELGLSSWDDLARRKPALQMSVREERDHCLHMVFDNLSRAAGFSPADVAAWGGALRHEAGPRISKAKNVAAGANAIFEEAAYSWVDEAVASGLDVLPMSEDLLAKVEAIGFRRHVLRAADYKNLPRDIPTIDFSGWAVFCRADAPEKLVTQICAAVEARKHLIPWQGDGPLPVERMCKDTPQTPMDVPLHPGAEKYWKSQGYI